MKYDITPSTYVRMTQASKGLLYYTGRNKAKLNERRRLERYFAWKDHVQRLNIKLPKRGASIIFVLPMPESWARNKRLSMCGEPHEQTPDLKNLLSALEDAVYHKNHRDIGMRDDKVISHYKSIEKQWGNEGAIIITAEK